MKFVVCLLIILGFSYFSWVEYEQRETAALTEANAVLKEELSYAKAEISAIRRQQKAILEQHEQVLISLVPDRRADIQLLVGGLQDQINQENCVE